jgi:hypothetical protein
MSRRSRSTSPRLVVLAHQPEHHERRDQGDDVSWTIRMIASGTARPASSQASATSAQRQEQRQRDAAEIVDQLLRQAEHAVTSSSCG